MGALAFSRFGEATLALGESPVWDDRRQLLFCVDITAPAVHAFRLDGTQVRQWPMPGRFAGSLGLCRSGRLIVALERSLVLLDPETGQMAHVATVEGMPAGTRLNDGKVGPDGAFHVGSMDNRGPDREAIGSLCRVTAAGVVTEQIGGGLKVSNGLAWSPDGRTMFHSDSSGGWIACWAFDAGSGAISNRHEIVSGMDETAGRPDGAACVEDGSYLGAVIYGGRLNRWSPDGKLIEHIPVPVPTPTMPCFCGPDLRTLVITSLVPGHGRPAHPASGQMFIAEAPWAGVPIHRFAD
jgi:sugar lactone lactonase YvrE